MFGKRAANKQMFSCEAPLFVEPPTQGLHLANSYKTHNNQVGKRHLEGLCWLLTLCFLLEGIHVTSASQKTCLHGVRDS